MTSILALANERPCIEGGERDLRGSIGVRITVLGFVQCWCPPRPSGTFIGITAGPAVDNNDSLDIGGLRVHDLREYRGALFTPSPPFA